MLGGGVELGDAAGLLGGEEAGESFARLGGEDRVEGLDETGLIPLCGERWVSFAREGRESATHIPRVGGTKPLGLLRHSSDLDLHIKKVRSLLIVQYTPQLTSEKGLNLPPGNASVISLGTPQNEPTLPTAASSFFLAFSLADPVERAPGATPEQVTQLVSRSTMATSGGRSVRARERERLGMPMSQGPGSCG